jgi:hypothetical protein
VTCVPPNKHVPCAKKRINKKRKKRSRITLNGKRKTKTRNKSNIFSLEREEGIFVLTRYKISMNKSRYPAAMINSLRSQ